jgi:hypothetical protein
VLCFDFIEWQQGGGWWLVGDWRALSRGPGIFLIDLCDAPAQNRQLLLEVVHACCDSTT